MKVSRLTLLKAAASTLLAALCLHSAGCSEPTRKDEPAAADAPAAKSAPPASRQNGEPPPAVAARPGAEKAAASPEELRECVGRVSRGALVVEGGGEGSYVTGDFNGDDSQDVAVVVRPVRAKLAEINDELANWILEDPRKVQLPGVALAGLKPGEKPERVTVAQGDLLLAVVHGHRAEGWRNPAATQTYLLKNAVGGGLKLVTRVEAQAARRAEGRPADLTGDVIGETLANEAGYLYWTGAKYAWRH
ncbi:MAG TPA: hypothetical protein VF659_05545 [Pyrinomonadaceae bacterium]|jgi:hypothetical protein